MPFNTFGITDYTIGRGAIESLTELAGERVGLVVDDGVVDALGLMPRLEEILRPAIGSRKTLKTRMESSGTYA